MTTLGDLGVLIGAEIEEAGFNKAVSAIQGIDKAASSAAAGASAAMGQLGQAADLAAGRYIEASGRMREANGRFVSAATLAAEAAKNAGGSIGNLSDVAGRASTSINGGLVASFAAFDKAVRPLNDGIGRLGESAKDLGGSLTASVTTPLALLGGLSLKAAGDIQALEKGFAATYTGSEELSTALAKVQELAKLPGLGLEEALQGATNLQAAGFSADLARRSLSAFGNALATVGKGKADLEGVGLALSQIASKGKISAEEINQLAERVPQIRKAMQAAFGTADTEALNKLGIGATEFVEKVTAELEKLPKVTGGLNNAFENLSDAGTISLSKLGGALNKAFNVEGILDKLSEAVKGAADAFGELDPATQRLIFSVAAGAAAIGPLLFGFGAIVSAIPSVVAGLETLGLASTAALGPIGIGVAAVAAAAYLIISNWDDLARYFSASGEGGRVFSDLADSVRDSISVISDAFGVLKTEGDGSLGGLISASGVLRDVFLDITVGLTSVSNVAGGTIGTIVKLLQGDLSGAAQEAQRALYGLIDPLANLLGFTKAAPTETIASFFKVAETEKAIDEAALAGAVSLNQLTGSLQAASGAADKGAGLLATLRERLKQVREERERETTVSGVQAYNQQISSLEKQIKDLEGGTNKGKDALADLVKALRDSDRQLLALGDDYDTLHAKQSILESGIKNLIAAGYDPAGKAVQGYVAQLKDLNQVLGYTQMSSRVLKGFENFGKPGDFKLDVPELDKVPEVVLPDYKAIFSNAASDIARGSGGIEETFGTFTQAQADFNTRTGELLDEFPSQAFAQIGYGIGEAIGSGGDVLAAAGQELLKALASFLAEYGRYVIAKGVADIALGNVGQGIAEVVAGGALTVLGGIASGLGSSVGGSGATSSSLRATGATPTPSRATPAQQVNIVAEFKLRGPDLVAIARTNDYRVQRTS